MATALRLAEEAPEAPRLVLLDRTPRSQLDVMEFPDGHIRVTQSASGVGTTTLILTPERQALLRAYLNQGTSGD